MNISLAFSDLPPPGHSFRIWCFLACGYLAPDGSFTQSADDAKVFLADDFNSALDFADNHICDFLLKNFHSYAALGSFRPCPCPSCSNLDATVFIQFNAI